MAQEKITFKEKLMAWARFFKSPYFIKNICIYIATIILFVVLVTQGLKWYTRHNQKISVPSVEGLYIADAQKIIEERGLVAQVLDSTFNCSSQSIKPGQIIPGGQSPTPGYQVKKGRIIYLTYLAYTKEPTTMPNIVLESVETAKSLLECNGLIPGKITQKRYPHKDVVIEARFNGALVSHGKNLHKGDVIDLVIGTGEDDANDSDTFAPSQDDSNELLEDPNGLDQF